MSLSTAAPPLSHDRRLQVHPLEPLLRIPDKETDLELRGIEPINLDRALQLRDVARTFVVACNAMFQASPLERLSDLLAELPAHRHGFLVEGAAMGAAIRDSLSMTDRLLGALRSEHAARFDYLISVGAGWAIARTPWREGRIRRSLDPRHILLSCDGRGFHDLYFHPQKARTGQISRYRDGAAKNYDAGLGRAMWFVGSGDPSTVLALVGAFPPDRHGDLFAGLGLAMAYAGPADAADWAVILTEAAPHRRALGQGICFAAEALRQADSLTPNAELAARHVLGLSANAAADIAKTTKPAPGLPMAEACAAYETWRATIRAAIPQSPETWLQERT